MQFCYTLNELPADFLSENAFNSCHCMFLRTADRFIISSITSSSLALMILSIPFCSCISNEQINLLSSSNWCILGIIAFIAEKRANVTEAKFVFPDSWNQLLKIPLCRYSPF
jgi:hypothetical protein